MYISFTSFLPLLFWLARAQDDDQPKHGEGEEGSSMGPVAFMWPPDRPWAAEEDNTGPCGSAKGPAERTQYPLTQGSVALNIADDAWHVAFRIAYGNNPTTQSAFADQIVSNITDIDPGHACYKLNQLEGITAGTNATIQLEYWADFEGENNGNNQSFFACADVTFVQAKDFTLQVPCFNVTSEDFDAPTPTENPTANPTGNTQSSGTAAAAGPGLTEPSSSEGLSAGAKAGIAVGAILGGLILAALAFFLYRRGKLTGIKAKQAYELRAKKLDTTTEPNPA